MATVVKVTFEGGDVLTLENALIHYRDHCLDEVNYSRRQIPDSEDESEAERVHTEAVEEHTYVCAMLQQVRKAKQGAA